MYLTEQAFIDKSKNNSYWEDRWDYMKVAISKLEDMKAVSICEAGTGGIPLNSDSNLMEKDKKNLINKHGIEWDLNTTPYPFKDKQFDCFVALQVWEHLSMQLKAFKEVERISRHALISFPYKWTAGNAMHNNIDKSKILEWTGKNFNSSTIIRQVHHGSAFDRILCLWEF